MIAYNHIAHIVLHTKSYHSHRIRKFLLILCTHRITPVFTYRAGIYIAEVRKNRKNKDNLHVITLLYVFMLLC